MPDGGSVLVDGIAIVLWIGVTAYAVLGGADFGAGFWDLVAGGARRGARPRALVDVSIGPVWEANHTWLIFVLVLTWTAFPAVFAAITTTLYVPLLFAAVGIVLRGSGFAFRHATQDFASRRAFGEMFAVSSLLTPFFLGVVLGAIAAGNVPVGGDASSPWASWWNAPALWAGVLAVAATAFLAAVNLIREARSRHLGDLEAYFRRRALASGAVTGMWAVLGLVIARDDVPELWSGLQGDARWVVALSAVAGVATLLLVARGVVTGTRELAVVAVAAIVWAWGLAQRPAMLPGPEGITISEAAASAPTLWALVVAVALIVVFVGGSLALLFSLDQRGVIEDESVEEEAAGNVPGSR
jgi:cytochrome d ubiquinol oxidase subunit II